MKEHPSPLDNITDQLTKCQLLSMEITFGSYCIFSDVIKTLGQKGHGYKGNKLY